MPFEVIEISQNDAEPIECYHFTYMGSDFAYTSAGIAVSLAVLDSRTISFSPTFIKRGKFGNSDDINKVNVEITVAFNNPVYGLFLQWMEGYVFIDIYRHHYNDSDSLPYWRGRILSARQKGSEAILICESSFTTIKKPGLRRIFQRPCNHILYDSHCTLSRTSFDVAGTVSVISGNTITVPIAAGYGAGYFMSGYAVFGQEIRLIIVHSGALLTLNGPFSENIEVGSSVMMYPGCDKQFSTCRDRFNNELNFGGFTHIPLKNPFKIPLV